MSTYSQKLNEALTAQLTAWWEGLSKEELLAYLAEQEDLTADGIREMLAAVNVNLDFGVDFSLANKTATVDMTAEEEDDVAADEVPSSFEGF